MNIKQYKLPIIIACVQWLFLTVLQIDKYFYTGYFEWNIMLIGKSRLYDFMKISFLVFLCISWCFIFFIIRQYKAENEKIQRGVHLFAAYSLIMMGLLFLFWPGLWELDDIYTILQMKDRYYWYPWQHILTGFYQMLFVQLLPTPGGIIFCQIILISVCVAFVIVKLEYAFSISKLKYAWLDYFVKFIPFLLPPVLIYQFSGYRIALYMYLELVLLIMLLCMTIEKKPISWNYLVLMTLVAAVVATWRTEGIFYVPLCIGVLVANRKILGNKHTIIGICLVLVFFCRINTTQTREIENGNGSNYAVMSTVSPVTALVRASDPVEEKDVLEDIDAVVDVDIIRTNKEYLGTALYFMFDLVRDGYTDAEYADYMKAFIKLCLRYPEAVISERFGVLFDAMGISEIENQVVNGYRAQHMFDENAEEVLALFKEAGWIADTPVFPDLRAKLINFMRLRTVDEKPFIIYRVFWNTLVPTLILIWGWIKCLVKKQWLNCGILFAVLLKFPVVLLAGPDPWFMYHLSFYFLGYVFLTYSLLMKKEKLKNE